MKLVLVDDHALFREGLSLLIAQVWPFAELIQADSLHDARHRLSAHPDVRLVLLDLGLPDSDGLEGLRRLREQTDRPAYVVMSARDDAETVLAAIEAGAAGFVPKAARSTVMIDALTTILERGVFLPSSVSGTPHAARPAQSIGLSPRQIEVLQLLVEGRSNKAICRELDLSESTVKTHLVAIFRKLDASTRTQAVVAAARMGLRFNG